MHSEGFIESSSATVGCWLLRKTDKRQDKTRVVVHCNLCVFGGLVSESSASAFCGEVHE